MCVSLVVSSLLSIVSASIDRINWCNVDWHPTLKVMSINEQQLLLCLARFHRSAALSFTQHHCLHWSWCSLHAWSHLDAHWLRDISTLPTRTLTHVSPKEWMLLHANLKLMSVKLPCEMHHVWSNVPTRLTSSLARLLTRCAGFVMVRCTCCHIMMPAGSHNIVTEHGVGTQRFRSNLCSGIDLVSFPSGRTSVLGLELGTQLWFVD